jgi:hypothetical protein
VVGTVRFRTKSLGEHWDASTAISIADTFWDFVPCSSSSTRRFEEHIASILKVPWGDRVELELHSIKTQKASVTDTAVKASLKTAFFDHK